MWNCQGASSFTLIQDMSLEVMEAMSKRPNVGVRTSLCFYFCIISFHLFLPFLAHLSMTLVQIFHLSWTVIAACWWVCYLQLPPPQSILLAEWQENDLSEGSMEIMNVKTYCNTLYKQQHPSTHKFTDWAGARDAVLTPWWGHRDKVQCFCKRIKWTDYKDCFMVIKIMSCYMQYWNLQISPQEAFKVALSSQ